MGFVVILNGDRAGRFELVSGASVAGGIAGKPRLDGGGQFQNDIAGAIKRNGGGNIGTVRVLYGDRAGGLELVSGGGVARDPGGVGGGIPIMGGDLGRDLHVYGLFRVRGHGLPVHLHHINGVRLRAFANIQHLPHLCRGQVRGRSIHGAIIALEGCGGRFGEVGVNYAVAINQFVRGPFQLFRRKVEIVLVEHYRKPLS